MEPIVSIVMPTYNAENTIDRALNSVFIQSFKDYELIVVDDCSTDDTIYNINLWKNIFKEKIKIYSTKNQSGTPVLPRNIGCIKAIGKYIAFLDADDFWYLNKLQYQINYMEKYGLYFTYHNMRVKNKDHYILWNDMSTCHAGYVSNELILKNFIPTSSVILRRRIYEKFGGMISLLKISHDWELWLRISRKYQIHYISKLLGTLCLQENSVITKVHNRRVESRKVVRMNKYYSHPKIYRKALLYYYIIELFDIIPNFLKKFIRDLWYNRKGNRWNIK